MEKVMATLEAAIDKNDGASLTAALTAAYAINPPLDHQMVQNIQRSFQASICYLRPHLLPPDSPRTARTPLALTASSRASSCLTSRQPRRRRSTTRSLQ